ncbi:MAG: cupin domain-containing protein [Croceitalea sp.]|nr:cupin domain-containing protein [Croceitalea sp.]MBT8237496.1 cupin domain-containing protein [Croceitalea sp.]NNM17891.1 cupin domain-containing protein [Croceitalea sp.]
MISVESLIKKQPFKGLTLEKIASQNSFEILSITLEKDAIFPEHTSPKDAVLLLLEGQIEFHINNENHKLDTQQHMRFPKETIHWVKAHQNSKFLIIR